MTIGLICLFRLIVGYATLLHIPRMHRGFSEAQLSARGGYLKTLRGDASVTRNGLIIMRLHPASRYKTEDLAERHPHGMPYLPENPIFKARFRGVFSTGWRPRFSRLFACET